MATDTKIAISKARTLVSQGLNRWGEELSALMPKRLRDLFVRPREDVVIEIRPQNVLRVARLTDDGLIPELTTKARALTGDPDIDGAHSIAALAVNAEMVIVAVPEASGFRRAVTLDAVNSVDLKSLAAAELAMIPAGPVEEYRYALAASSPAANAGPIAGHFLAVHGNLAESAVTLARSLGVEPTHLSIGLPTIDRNNLISLAEPDDTVSETPISRSTVAALIIALMSLAFLLPFVRPEGAAFAAWQGYRLSAAPLEIAARAQPSLGP